jgi:predicted permease
MRSLAWLRAWLRNVTKRSRFEREMADEFRSHIAHRADDLERSGLTREAAQRTARMEFGSVEGYKEMSREVRGLRFIDELLADIRFARRNVRANPLLSGTVVITLALGIGISSGVFAVLDAVSLRPRVDGDTRTFVRVLSSYGTDSTRPGFPGATTLSDYLAYRDGSRALRVLAGWQNVLATINDDPAPVGALLVTCEFFDVYAFGRPIAGRTLRAEDCDRREPVTMISEPFWRNRLSAGDVVGHVIRYNGRPFQIVGIAPATFGGQLNRADLWMPYTTRGYMGLGPDEPSAPNAIRLNLDGRLRPGYSRSDVRAEVTVLAARQDRLHPGRRTVAWVTDGSLLQKPGSAGVVVAVVALTLAALTCLALVACSNVVSLLLARADARQREMAMRTALGATGTRLVRMLLTETLLLASLAGVIATYLAYRTPPVLLAWIIQRSAGFPVQPRWTVFAFLAALTLLLGIFAAVAPARAALELDVVGALKGLSGKSARHGRRLGRILVGAQMGAAAMLLIGAAVLVRIPTRIAASPPRFEMRQVMMPNLVPADRTRAPNAWTGFHEDIATALHDVPGVVSIAFGSSPPANDERIGSVAVTPPGQSTRNLPTIEVSADYFAVFGIPIRRGRAIAAADTACPARVCAVVVSRELVREVWPNEDPIGKRLAVDPTVSFEVVGVAEDATSPSVDANLAVMLYQPWSPAAARYHTFVRFAGSADQVGSAVVAGLRRRFPNAAISPQTIQSSIDFVTAGLRRMGLVAGGVAIIAAVLALVGVYGVVSLAARRRTKEMGIRIALGARTRDVHRTILGASAPSVVVGLTIGLALTAVVAIVVDRMAAHAIPARFVDTFSFAAAALALVGVALAAMAAPAHRAASADPLEALRHD